MTRSDINSKVHARLGRMLAHAGVDPYTREEWATIVRPLVDEHGSRTKVIAREARDQILASRTPEQPHEEFCDHCWNGHPERCLAVAHEPIDDATRIFAQVA